MERVRVVGIVPIKDGFCFMHRRNVVKNKNYNEYYTFPGGGLEEGETYEEGTIREIKEELGIKVRVIKKIYETYFEKLNQKELYFLCEYMEGDFGTGEGPEFNNDPKYIESGEYLPEIISREKIKDLFLLPQEIKEKFIKDIEDGKI